MWFLPSDQHKQQYSVCLCIVGRKASHRSRHVCRLRRFCLGMLPTFRLCWQRGNCMWQFGKGSHLSTRFRRTWFRIGVIYVTCRHDTSSPGSTAKRIFFCNHLGFDRHSPSSTWLSSDPSLASEPSTRTYP